MGPQLRPNPCPIPAPLNEGLSIDTTSPMTSIHCLQEVYGCKAEKMRQKSLKHPQAPALSSDDDCHGTPCPPCPHAPNHLRSSPTPSTYTLVSLRCTLRKLAQPCHSCCQTKLRSMSNFPRLCPYVSGHHLFVFFSICRICLMHFH